MAVNTNGENELANGVRLPVGFRFDPTDDILVYSYLKNKIFNQPLPFNSMIEFDVFQTEPWLLPEDRYFIKNKKYYFYEIKNRYFRNIPERVAGNGEWRMVEMNKEIALPNNLFIGKKNTLVYWKIQENEAVKTRWIMQEFCISKNFYLVSKLSAYRIFKIKVAKKKVNTPRMMDFTIDDASSSNSAPTA